MTIQSEIKPLSVSIIVPAFNEENYINHCLESIVKLNPMSLDKEIIVVDNGSCDKTVEICKSYGAKVLLKKEGTIASLRNYGAKTSRGKFLAFLDADCVVPKNWLEKALTYLSGDGRVILGFRLSIPENCNWVAKCWDLLFAKRYFTAEVDWIPSGNMIMTREAFMSTNGFDEKLESNEDYDFCARMRKQGYKIISSSDISIMHGRPPQTLLEIFKKELWHGKEVLKVFINDIYGSKDIYIFKRKNFKVVLYAFGYLLFILFQLFCFILAISTKTFLPLLVALLFPVITSFLMALKNTRLIKKYNLIFGLTILFVIYGFSRAISLLPYNKIKKWIPNL
jgi:glycosyltransferase involved in cell wall biosynthesis